VLLIRTGILCIPHLDEAAIHTVHTRLRQTMPGVQILREASAASQRHWIEEIVRQWCDEEELDLVLTIGGTLPAPGSSGQECVPEATLAVLERSLPGLSEEMRAYARDQQVLALLDRGVAGIRSRSLIINLPAGVVPATLFLEAIIELIEPIIAHLQEQPDAPRLGDVFTLNAPDARVDQPLEAAEVHSDPQPKALNADEFRAFLQRKTQNQT
jgi:molybdopterin adenylyltransferase